MKLFPAEPPLAGGVAGSEWSESMKTGRDVRGPDPGSGGVAVLGVGPGQPLGPWATVNRGRS